MSARLVPVAFLLLLGAGPPRARTGQVEADPLLIERLRDVEGTVRLLADAPVATDPEGIPRVVATTESRGNPKVRFRITFEDPAGGTFDAIFKPKQRYYRDWIGEILSARIAAELGVRITPVVERRIRRADLEDALLRLPADLRRLVSWEEDEAGAAFVRGSLAYWVPGFHPRVGEYRTDQDDLERLADELRRDNVESVREEESLQDLAGVLLLDYLVLNEDRLYNLGTVRLPGSDRLLLVPIDQGDTLVGPGGRGWRCRRLWQQVQVYPRDLVGRLRALDPETLRGLLSSPAGGPGAGDEVAAAVIDRRERALARIDEALAAHGEGILVDRVDPGTAAAAASSGALPASDRAD